MKTEIEQRQAELAGLRDILKRMPDDPLAKPLMASRVRSLERELARLEKTPPPKAEAFSGSRRNSKLPLSHWLRLFIKNAICMAGYGHRLIEYCQICGRKQPVVWRSDDALWLKIVGGKGGVLCPECFDRRATSLGYIVEWKATGDL